MNLRGRIIEYLITTDDTTRKMLCDAIMDKESLLPEFSTHDDLGDYVRSFDNGNTFTDIKTKVIYLDSAPKAYNVDKFLEKMAEDGSLFFFYIIGIDENRIFRTVLCSVYHDELVDASVVQHHWAGRATRGVVQFSGKALNNILLRSNFNNHIDQKKAKSYLQMLLDR